MSDSSRHQVSVILEETRGTTPATPAMTVCRQTGCTLELKRDILLSEESRMDRNRTSGQGGAKQIGGDLSGDFTYGNDSHLLLAALFGGSWTAPSRVGTVLSAVGSDHSYNDSEGKLLSSGLKVGDRIAVAGFTGNVANNCLGSAPRTITALTAYKATIGGTDGSTIVDDAAGESVTIAVVGRDILSNGVVRRPLTFERWFSDLASVDEPFHRFKGIELATGSFQIQANKVITFTYGCVGMDMDTDTAIITGETYIPASTTTPFASFRGVIKEGGVEIGIVTEIKLSLDNGMAPLFAIGSNLSLEPEIKAFVAKGDMTVFFRNSTLLKKFTSDTTSSLVFSLVDLEGNEYEFTVPNIKYTGSQIATKGSGTIMQPMPFEAFYSASSAATALIQRKDKVS